MSSLPSSVVYDLQFNSFAPFICSSIYLFIHSFPPESALQQVHSLFQSEFSIERDVLLPLSNFSALSFL
jgi:hypothetical protein